MVSVDMRTRLDADVVLIDPVTFVADDLPDLLRRNGHLAARGAALVGAKALGIDVEGTDFTLVPTGHTIELHRGTAHARVVVDLDRSSFSDLVQDLQRWWPARTGPTCSPTSSTPTSTVPSCRCRHRPGT